MDQLCTLQQLCSGTRPPQRQGRDRRGIPSAPYTPGPIVFPVLFVDVPITWMMGGGMGWWVMDGWVDG